MHQRKSGLVETTTATAIEIEIEKLCVACIRCVYRIVVSPGAAPPAEKAAPAAVYELDLLTDDDLTCCWT